MLERIHFNSQDADSMSEAAEKAVAVLRRGGVVLYPTDTIYGLGADALSVEAIERINKIKDRGQNKRMIILASDIEMAKQYTVWNDSVQKLAETFWPGPLTIELEHKQELPDALTGGIRRGGVRMPDHAFSRALVEKFGRPITSTSANISGREQALTFEGILEDLGEHHDMLSLAIEEDMQEESSVRLPSTVVSIENGHVVVVREGAITKEQLNAML